MFSFAIAITTAALISVAGAVPVKPIQMLCAHYFGNVDEGTQFRSNVFTEEVRDVLGNLAPKRSQIRLLGDGGSGIVYRVINEGKESTYKIFEDQKDMLKVVGLMKDLAEVHFFQNLVAMKVKNQFGRGFAIVQNL